MYGCAFEIMYALLASVSRTQLITSWVENKILAYVRFSKFVQFQIHPPLNIFLVPDWLNFKFHCFLIGPKGKNFGYLNSIGSHLCNIFSSVLIHVNSFTRPAGFS